MLYAVSKPCCAQILRRKQGGHRCHSTASNFIAPPSAATKQAPQAGRPKLLGGGVASELILTKFTKADSQKLPTLDVLTKHIHRHQRARYRPASAHATVSYSYTYIGVR